MTSISSQERVVQQIISTHSPDANFTVDEKALLSMANDILCKAISQLPQPQDLKIDLKVSEDKSHQQVITEELAFTILGIGCELSCNCSGGGGMKSITLAVFDKLVKYSWKNKVVIALLAFAVNYGELCLLWKLDATNPLTKYVDQLKLLLEISEQEAFIIRQGTLISGLLEVIMRVTMTIIELNDLPSYFSHDNSAPLSENQISTAVYWAVKGIVACSSQSIALVNLQYMVSNTEVQKKLTELTQALETIHEDLRHTMTVFIQEREVKKYEEGYIKIKNLIEKSTQKIDNQKIFTELIQTKDDKPLFNGVTSKKESLKVLKSKRVILFISNPDILDEEIIEIAQRVSTPTPVRPYEIVWFPIVDMPNTKKDVIEEKTRLMKWRSLHYSVTLQPYVIQYIKKDWHFEKKPVMVVFNAHGKVVNSNAYHMIMIWRGNAASPFFANREETLWRKSKWNLEFLIDGVASDEWIKEGKLACFFEDDDLDRIKKFISAMKGVVEGERIRLIYVGQKHREPIKNEKLCEWWDDHKIKLFWARLNSMLYSKMKSGTSIDQDKTFKDVMMLLGCSGSGEGWTVIGQGSNSIVASNGKTTMKCLDTMKTNEIKLTSENYLTKHRELISQVDVEGKTHGNYDIHIASTRDIIQEKMVCVDCRCPMAKRVTYSCSGKKE